MATEIEDTLDMASERYIRNAQGIAVDPLGLAMARVTPGYEQHVMALPEQQQGDDTPLQDEYGNFYFMMDRDGLGEAPLA